MRQNLQRGDSVDRADEVTVAAGAEPAVRRARLSWGRLARIMAVGDLLVLAVVGIGRRDVEALAIAALLLVAAALAGWRRGVPGLVLLALLFIDVAAFMAPAAVSNAAAGETLGGVALPASLAAMSIAGVLAAVAALAAARRARSAGRDPHAHRVPPAAGRGPALLAAGTVAVLAATLGAVAVVGPSRPTAVQGSQRLDLKAARTQFSTTSLAAHPGRVTVSLANRDLFWHTFTIESLGVNVDAPVGGTRSVTFTVAPGTYRFFCAIPGHAAAGMRGTLTVR